MSAILAFILGTVLGSFVNALASRLPRGEEWLRTRSHCDSCRHELGFFDLVPMVSFLTLGGRCRYCSVPLAIWNPLVELVCGVLVMLGFWKFGITLAGAAFAVLCILLVLIAVIDLEHQIVFDSLVAILALVALTWPGVWSDLGGHVAGAAIASAVFWLIRWAGGMVWKREAMGMGDVKLAAALGFWVGWMNVYPLVLYAFILGLAGALVLVFLRRAEMSGEIPFGPYLCASAALLVFFS